MNLVRKMKNWLSLIAERGGTAADPRGEGEGEREVHGLLLDILPKDCLVRVVSFLSPIDACKASCVCKAFRSAADADEAWERRLPKNYKTFLDDDDTATRRKDLYHRLLSGIIVKNGTLAYWIDSEVREGSLMLPARALHIVWGDDGRYWHWVPLQSRWFDEGAYLNDVCWLEVGGELEANFQPGSYTVSFRLFMERSHHGWERAPVKFSLSTSNGHHVESARFLSHEGHVPTSALTPARSFGDCKEFDAGEFLVESEMSVKLQFCMIEIEGGWWKRGIVVEGVKIQPSKALKGTSF